MEHKWQRIHQLDQTACKTSSKRHAHDLILPQDAAVLFPDGIAAVFLDVFIDHVKSFVSVIYNIICVGHKLTPCPSQTVDGLSWCQFSRIKPDTVTDILDQGLCILRCDLNADITQHINNGGIIRTYLTVHGYILPLSIFKIGQFYPFPSGIHIFVDLYWQDWVGTCVDKDWLSMIVKFLHGYPQVIRSPGSALQFQHLAGEIRSIARFLHLLAVIHKEGF